MWRNAGRFLLGACGIVLLTLLAYSPVFAAQYIWDDAQWVFLPPSLQTLSGLKRVWLEPGVNPQYYPITFSMFWLECRLWADQLIWYHVLNVVLHGFSGVVLWTVLRRLRVTGAWVAACIWALHPVQVESVAWIVELKTILSGLFCFASVLAWLHFVDRDPERPAGEPWRAFRLGGRGWVLYAASLLLFGCSLLSKTMSVGAPAALLVLLWWKRRLRPGHALALVPFFLFSALSAVPTVLFESRFTQQGVEKLHIAFLDRILIAGRVFWFYIGKILWPARLCPVYPKWHIDAGAWWQFLYPVAAAVAVAGVLVFHRRLGRGVVAALLFFGITLSPFFGLVNFALLFYTYVADRFVYLPSVGLIVLFVAVVHRMFTRLKDWGAYMEGVVWTFVVLVFAIASWWQTGIYENSEIYWRAAVKCNPTEALCQNNLGGDLLERGNIEEAIPHLQEAVRLKPDFSVPVARLGVAYYRLGEPMKAVPYLERAIEMGPVRAKFYNMLGDVYRRIGDPRRAIAEYRAALRLYACDVDAWQRLAWLYATCPDPKIRNGQRALRFARYALSCSQLQRPSILDAMAAAHAELEQFDRALRVAADAYRIAIATRDEKLAQQIARRIQLYRARLPYRELPGPLRQ